MTSIRDRQMNQDEQTKIGNALDHIQKLPSMPSLMVEIMESFNNEDVDVTTLANKIATIRHWYSESDAGGQFGLFRLVRSDRLDFRGGIGAGFQQPAGSGNSRCSHQYLSAYGKRLQLDSVLAPQYQHRRLRQSAGETRRTKLGTAFTTGLLHDIGRLVMGVYFPQAFSRTAPFVAGSTLELLHAEHEALGFDHAAALGGPLVNARRLFDLAAARSEDNVKILYH